MYEGQRTTETMGSKIHAIFLLVLLCIAPAGLAAQARSGLDRLPLHFIENRGLYPEEVAYFIRGGDKCVFFTPEGVTYQLAGQDRTWAVKLDFVGGNPAVRPEGREALPARFSVFKGEASQWKTGLRSFSRVVYADLWPGIDLVYRGDVGRLKYAFHVRPGADVSRIRLRYRGASRVVVTAEGALRVETPAGGFEDAPPVAYQVVDGVRAAVDVSYAPGLAGEPRFSCGFHIGAYDSSQPLILDPAVLVYCGYIHGAYVDHGTAVAVDAAGCAYVVGSTGGSSVFPVKVGPCLNFKGVSDAFVAKVNAAGTALVYCGFIGGANEERGEGVAVDAAGNAYVCGSTRSPETSFPVVRGPDLTFNSVPGSWDAFVARVNVQGTALDYCGYLGGAKEDFAEAVAVDAAGCAYLTGHTYSPETSFPVKTGPYGTFNGAIDAYVAKVNPLGTALDYCGYLGGTQNCWGQGIAVDASGHAFVVGMSYGGLPVKTGPDLTYNGRWDGFLLKVNPAGSGYVYCGYIGGSSDEYAHDVDLDAFGNAYVAGCTSSNQQSFPVKVGPDLTFNCTGPSADAYVARVNPSGTGIVFCGYIGGTGGACARGIAVDACGNAYLAGYTLDSEVSFPVRTGPDITYNGGYSDAFVARVRASGRGLDACGYIGGLDRDLAEAVAVDAAGRAFVVGTADSDHTSFPVKTGPHLIYNGNPNTSAAFVACIDYRMLTGSGTPRPGGTVTLKVSAHDSPGLACQFGTSLGTGPVPLDTRILCLDPDPLLVISVSGTWPWVFTGYAGRTSAKGEAAAVIQIPGDTALIGVALHSACLTLEAVSPSGVKEISDTFTFRVVK